MCIMHIINYINYINKRFMYNIIIKYVKVYGIYISLLCGHVIRTKVNTGVVPLQSSEHAFRLVGVSPEMRK